MPCSRMNKSFWYPILYTQVVAGVDDDATPRRKHAYDAMQ